MGRRNQEPPEDAIADYKLGKPTKDIAAEYGMTVGNVSHWARKVGLPKRRRGNTRKAEPDESAKRVLIRLNDSDQPTYEQVAKEFGLTKQAVQQLSNRWQDWRLALLAMQRQLGVSHSSDKNPIKLRGDATWINLTTLANDKAPVQSALVRGPQRIVVDYLWRGENKVVNLTSQDGIEFVEDWGTGRVRAKLWMSKVGFLLCGKWFDEDGESHWIVELHVVS